VTLNIVVRVQASRDKTRKSVSHLESHHVREKGEICFSRCTIILDFDMPADGTRVNGKNINSPGTGHSFRTAFGTMGNTTAILGSAKNLGVADSRELTSVETPLIEFRRIPPLRKLESQCSLSNRNLVSRRLRHHSDSTAR
jgi:hypothetical protein